MIFIQSAPLSSTSIRVHSLAQPYIQCQCVCVCAVLLPSLAVICVHDIVIVVLASIFNNNILLFAMHIFAELRFFSLLPQLDTWLDAVHFPLQ